MGNSPKMTKATEKIVRHSENLRYQSLRHRTDLQGKLMRMQKVTNKKFDIVNIRDSGCRLYQKLIFTRKTMIHVFFFYGKPIYKKL